ncbi:MAG: N-acetylmuramoyl-L-alanine amidase [Lachnospiraceae bacterium]|nr:N-acetylmuramoyl-L-alanine amidase [Lachnospiraceae bacterium]MBO5372459.1 N-acetylmuramoyl-L-alanine amidase [Lachnospiraceae bacterium]
MKKYKSSFLVIVMFMLVLCAANINIQAAQSNGISAEAIEQNTNLNYTVLDRSQLTTPQTQKIVVSVGEIGANYLSMAQLTVKNSQTGETTEVYAEQISEDAALFSIDYSDESQKGIYILDRLNFTYNGMESCIVYEETDTVKYAVNEEISTNPDQIAVDEAEVEAEVIQLDAGEGLDAFALTDALRTNARGSSYSAEGKAGKKKGDMVIVLDPGHGGSDPGAIANNLKEKDITLKIATYCKEELEKYDGIQIFMTRTGDTYPTLDERIIYATSVNADLFVSFHINSFYTTTAAGVEVYYPNSNYKPELGTEGKGVAEAVLKKLVELGLKNRGVKYTDSSKYKYADSSAADGYAVIRGAKNAGYPGILIEHAFISNPSEAQTYLGSDAALKKLGVADAQGIVEYYDLALDSGLKKPEITKLTAKDSAVVTLKWNEVSDATGYQIYRSTKENGTYKKIATIKNASTVSYKDTSIKEGKNYFYKMRAYTDEEKSDYSGIESIRILKTPVIASIKKSAGQLKITWKNMKNATKYQIYRSTEKNGTYTKVAAVKAGKTTYTNTALESNTKYYYKIRAYCAGVGGKSYSAYSVVKGKRTK